MGVIGKMGRRGGDGAGSGRIWEEAAREVGGCEKQGGGSGEPAVRGGRVEEGRKEKERCRSWGGGGGGGRSEREGTGGAERWKARTEGKDGNAPPYRQNKRGCPTRNSPSSNKMQSYYSVISFTVRSPIKIPVLK